MFKKIKGLIAKNTRGEAAEITNPSKILMRQVVRLGLIAGVLVIVTAAVVNFLAANKEKGKKPIEEEQAVSVPIVAASSAIDPEKMWRNHFEDKLTENTNEVSQKLRVIEDSMAKKEEEIAERNKKEMAEMEEKLRFARQELQDAINELKMAKEMNPKEQAREIEFGHNVVSHVIEDERQISRPKSSRNYIPETAYVQGVLLGGISVSTSVGSSSEPVPVAIRITGRGNLPASFAVDLKHCRILGSSYGDLSSERAIIRAEVLVCEQDEQIITTRVAGIVYGDDGSNGIKGKVVQTSNKQVQHALVGGVLSGFAATAKSADQFNISSIGAISTKKTGVGERLRDNSLAGVGNAGDKLADYYLRQAEMMSPVLQISGGTRVDVMFTKGVYLGSHGVRKELAKARTEQQGSGGYGNE